MRNAIHLYKENVITRKHELGMDHLLRVQCICNYMEEAAGNHADALGVGLDRLKEDGLVWVLAKMRLSLKRRPGPGESLLVTTWPVGMERAHFRRDFIIYDTEQAIAATAVTQWVIMGIESRRLERLPLYIAGLRPENPPLADNGGDIRIPAVATPLQTGLRFPVRLADIDQNRHVNNGRYIDFSLEAADDAGARGEIERIDLIFRAEGLRGDVITAATGREAGPAHCYIHSLTRESDGLELARARTVFRA